MPKDSSLHSVEIIGGSTRVPSVQNLIKLKFDKEMSRTLNADEAIS